MFGRRESLREFLRTEQEKSSEFQREILLRNEKVYTSVIAEMERMGDQIERMGDQIEEGRLQIRANTQAVLRLLDGFDEPGGAAPA